MPTQAERLARIEERMENVRDDVRELVAVIGDKSKPESVRGRLHKIEGYIVSAAAKRTLGVGFLKAWERSVLVLCAVGTVAAAWYGALH